MDSTGSSNVPGRVILELLASHGRTMCKEELQNIQLKVTQLLTEKEKAATTQSEYAIHGDQLYCPKEMVSPRGTLRNSKSANTANPWQVDGPELTARPRLLKPELLLCVVFQAPASWTISQQGLIV